MNYALTCKRCQHYNFDLQKGILCGLTKEKPSFQNECKDFLLDPNKEKEQIKSPTKKYFSKDAQLPDIKSQLKKWGIALIVLGFIHLLMSSFLSPVWGALLLVLGIINLAYINRKMFIVNGISLLFVGFSNIIGTIGVDGSFIWVIFGFLQLLWGGQEIRKYQKYSDVDDQNKRENTKEEILPNSQTEINHSKFGIFSFAIFCFSFIITFIFFIVMGITQGPNPEPIAENSPFAMLLGLGIMLTAFIVITGIALGIIGLFQKDKKKIFSILGLVLNSILATIFIVMILFAPKSF